MAISIHRPCRRTHAFKNWTRKELHDKKSYVLKSQGAYNFFLHYHFHETIKILTKTSTAITLLPHNVTSVIEKSFINILNLYLSSQKYISLVKVFYMQVDGAPVLLYFFQNHVVDYDSVVSYLQ